MPQIPFVGASYKERSVNLDTQACINLFPVMGESGTAKAVRALYGTPGTPVLATAVESIVRGMHRPTDGSDGIVVVGSRVYRISASFVLTAVGNVDSSALPVHIDDNGVDAVIVTGPSGYTLNLVSNALVQISDEAFYGSNNVDFLMGYGIFVKPRSNIFYITAANAITFDPLDFASAESNAEPIVTHVVSHEDIVFFKETVTEIWRSSGGADFPFARDTNASIEQGCAAANSVAKMDNTVFWLGKNTEGSGIVWKLNGYTPQRVSTDAIETAIASYSNISDAVAYSYQQEGHSFYVLTFPTASVTWVYDAATQLWHQRAYLNPSTGTLGRHRSNCHMHFGGKHIVGDYADGRLYALDLDYYKDGANDPLPSIRAASHVSGLDYEWIIHNRLQVDIESGVGLTSGQGITPKAYLDWSDDGGHEWSSQHAAQIGAKGKYRTRLRWNRLGRARDRVYRITISDPVKRVILGAALNPSE